MATQKPSLFLLSAKVASALEELKKYYPNAVLCVNGANCQAHVKDECVTLANWKDVYVYEKS